MNSPRFRLGWRLGGPLGLLAVLGCAPVNDPPRDLASPTEAEVWAAIQPQALRYRLEPSFIYAIVAAESGFDARARNGRARGLMQLKPEAWSEVRPNEAYLPTVWDWRQNLEAGIDYLAWLRARLQREAPERYSYPLLLAAYRYGPEHVRERRHELRRMRTPRHPVYLELWGGNLAPVTPPGPAWEALLMADAEEP